MPESTGQKILEKKMNLILGWFSCHHTGPKSNRVLLEGFKEIYSEVVTEASRIANELMLERRFSYALAQRPWSSIGFS